MLSRFLTSAPLPTLLAMASLSLAAFAQSPRYTVTDLGDGRSFSQAYTVSNNGLIAGLAATSTGTQHAVVWYQGKLYDNVGSGLGGPNSGALAINDRLEIAGQAETNMLDPNHENFCVYGTGLACVPFVWREGVLSSVANTGRIQRQRWEHQSAWRYLRICRECHGRSRLPSHGCSDWCRAAGPGL